MAYQQSSVLVKYLLQKSETHILSRSEWILLLHLVNKNQKLMTLGGHYLPFTGNTLNTLHFLSEKTLPQAVSALFEEVRAMLEAPVNPLYPLPKLHHFELLCQWHVFLKKEAADDIRHIHPVLGELIESLIALYQAALPLVYGLEPFVTLRDTEPLPCSLEVAQKRLASQEALIFLSLLDNFSEALANVNKALPEWAAGLDLKTAEIPGLFGKQCGEADKTVFAAIRAFCQEDKNARTLDMAALNRLLDMVESVKQPESFHHDGCPLFCVYRGKVLLRHQVWTDFFAEAVRKIQADGNDAAVGQDVYRLFVRLCRHDNGDMLMRQTGLMPYPCMSAFLLSRFNVDFVDAQALSRMIAPQLYAYTDAFPLLSWQAVFRQTMAFAAGEQAVLLPSYQNYLYDFLGIFDFVDWTGFGNGTTDVQSLDVVLHRLADLTAKSGFSVKQTHSVFEMADKGLSDYLQQTALPQHTLSQIAQTLLLWEKPSNKAHAPFLLPKTAKTAGL